MDDGSVAERSKAPDLKPGGSKDSVGSNPTASDLERKRKRKSLKLNGTAIIAFGIFVILLSIISHSNYRSGAIIIGSWEIILGILFFMLGSRYRRLEAIQENRLRNQKEKFLTND